MGLRRNIAGMIGMWLVLHQAGYADTPDPKIVSEIKGKCVSVQGEARILVKVRDLGSDEGNIRIQAYSDNPDEFLERGMYLMRVEVKASEGDRDVCVPMPAPGRYAIALLHDRNANGSADIFSEGFGFSRNPELGLSKPDHEEVVIDVPEGVSTQVINVHYVFGDGGESSQKRRRTRRR